MTEKKPRRPKAPAHLKAPGKALWAEVLSTYTLRPDELRVLEDAAQATDLLAEMTTEWNAKGRPFLASGSMGQEVEHPLIGAIEKQRRARQAALKLLDLPDQGGAAPVNQNRAAGLSRWAAAHGASPK